MLMAPTTTAAAHAPPLLGPLVWLALEAGVSLSFAVAMFGAFWRYWGRNRLAYLRQARA